MFQAFHKLLRIPYQLNVPINDHKPAKPTVVLLHGIGASSAAWESVVPLIGDDVHLMAVDLLGFGESPKPAWMDYSLSDHARSLKSTLNRRFMRRPVIVVGHSLGCLVAIEFASRWPHMVDRLILCSPPFYVPSERPHKGLPKRDDMYLQAYAAARTYSIGALALKYLGKGASGVTGIMVDETTLPAFMKTLQASIEGQQSYGRVLTMKKPIDIIYGRFDTFIIEKHIYAIAKANPKVSIYKIAAGHAITKKFAAQIVEVLKKATQ